MKPRIVATIAFIIILLLFAAITFISIRPSTSNPDTSTNPASIMASDADDLLHHYQSSLNEANATIEEFNLEIETAQAIESLDELEAYIDTIPQRDTIAHPSYE